MRITTWTRRLLIAGAALVCMSAQACDVNFKVAGDATSYPYAKLPQFVIDRVRQLVTATEDEMDRYDLEISTDCNANQPAPSVAVFSIQKNTVYLKDLNGVPLCTEEVTKDGLRCMKGKYNYVDYKGGSASLVASKATVADAVKVLSAVRSVSDLEEANKTPAARQKIHDAVRMFALILAESARFDYVLDDLRCTVNTSAGIKFMDYWTLVHNWGTITGFVKNKRPDLRPPFAVSGVGSLFVPVTRDLVTEFNKYLVKANPPPPTTPDGKNKEVPLRSPTCPLEKLAPASVLDAQLERDHIFSLGSMVMVQKDWQVDTKGRGHNIGSILVDSQYRPVFWARNAIRERDNATQHGEVRLIQNFLNCPKVGSNARGYTVYTTLEPCAMCAGMLSMTQVSRVVYVQTDEGFGRTLSALRAINYPRVYVEATPTTLAEKLALEAAFTKHKTDTKNNSVTDFLLSPDALKVFLDAGTALDAFQVKFSDNAVVLANTKAFLSAVTKEKYDAEMLAMCPAPQ